MEKRSILFSYLLLFAACFWPFINLLSKNIDAFSNQDYAHLCIFFFSIYVLLALCLTFYSCFHMPARSHAFALTLSVAVIVFFNFDTVNTVFIPYLPSYAINILYLLGFGLLSSWLYVRAPAPLIGKIVFILIIGGILLPFLNVAAVLNMRLSHTPANAVEALQQPLPPVQKPLPPEDKINVYYIIADEYARADQLKKILGFDNSPFLQHLQADGFYVADDAYANYPMTHLSIPTSLGMDFFIKKGMHASRFFQAALKVMSGDNETVRRFKSYGYNYLHAGCGWWKEEGCHPEMGEVCLQQPPKGVLSGELASLILRLTPLVNMITLDNVVTTAGGVHEAFTRAAPQKPYFMYAHTLPPHAPYLYDAKCHTLKNFNGMLLGTKATPSDATKTAYTDNVQCANQMLENFVDDLVKTDPKAIIILQSDHGSYFTFGGKPMCQTCWTPVQFKERYGILMAIRAPEECKKWLYPSLSPVNLMRFVFACVEHKAPDYTEDKSYLMWYDGFNDDDLAHEVPVSVFPDGITRKTHPLFFNH